MPGSGVGRRWSGIGGRGGSTRGRVPVAGLSDSVALAYDCSVPCGQGGPVGSDAGPSEPGPEESASEFLVELSVGRGIRLGPGPPVSCQTMSATAGSMRWGCRRVRCCRLPQRTRWATARWWNASCPCIGARPDTDVAVGRARIEAYGWSSTSSGPSAPAQGLPADRSAWCGASKYSQAPHLYVLVS